MKINVFDKVTISEIEKKEIMYDYREMIVSRKHDKKYWENWKDWNILYQTLAYESSSSKDVEKYFYVQEKAFSKYCKNYEKYCTADVMNGWWYCFKILFDVSSRKDKPFLEELLYKIRDKNNKQVIAYLCDTYPTLEKSKAARKELFAIFLLFLRLVYTIGNLTPAYENKYRCPLDNWEVKCIKQPWKDDEEKKLHFDIYNIQENANYPSNMDTNTIKEYMEQRIKLILKRAISIVKNNYSNMNVDILYASLLNEFELISD